MSPNLKKRIFIICPYPLDTAPSQRLHYEQYLDFLGSQGYCFKVFPFFSTKSYFLLYKKGFYLQKVLAFLRGLLSRIMLIPALPFIDGIYIHLNVIPLGPGIFEKIYIFLSKKVIYDINDMILISRTSKANAIVTRLKSTGRISFLLEYSNHVITCTPFLKQKADALNSSVTNIYTTVNTDLFRPSSRMFSGKEIVIGWSGSHSTAPYLHILDDPLKRLAEKYSFLLLVMGPSSFSIPGVKIEVVPWSVDVERNTFARMDIGLYPLPEDDWVKGKGGGKALQYMANGIPTVATLAGCNSDLIIDGVSGLLARKQTDWFYLLELLILDQGLREKLGMAARNLVEKFYSVEANKGTYLSIFEEVYGPTVHQAYSPIP